MSLNKRHTDPSFTKSIYTILRKLIAHALNIKSLTHIFFLPTYCRRISLRLKINTLSMYSFYVLL